MIIKSMSRKSNSSQLIKYIFRYVMDEEKVRAVGKNGMAKQATFMIRHNIRSRSSIKNLIKEFEENEKYRLVNRKDSVKIFHTIISFSNKDKALITDTLLKDISKKFIQERGLNNLYAGTVHRDKEHIHLHIGISGTQLNGRSSRVSKQQFNHIKLELERYQKEKYPQLIHSIVEHGKSKQRSKEAIVEIVKHNRQTYKQSLGEILQSTYSRSKSVAEFFSQLEEQGKEVYYRNGKAQGIIHEQMKFRFSRLGYDDTMIKALDELQTTEQHKLHQLEHVRKGNVHELENRKELRVPQETTVAQMNNEEQMLNELSLLRSREAQEMELSVQQALLVRDVKHEQVIPEERSLVNREALENLQQLRGIAALELERENV